jgi:hypothetical protein
VSRIRLSAIITLVLLGVYHVTRVIAPRCNGSACDAYVPLSVLLPVLVLAAAACTSILAVSGARLNRSWLSFLISTAALGVVGPLLIFTEMRDNPAAFIFLSTALVIAVPVNALLFTFFSSGADSQC